MAGNRPETLVAETGLMKGLHTGMGFAAKGMVVAFVVFTILNVEFASSIYQGDPGLGAGVAGLVLTS